MLQDVETVLTLALPVVFAVVLHEIAHGLVAYWRGDPTAKEAGRLTLNPIPHVDPVGTVVLPVLLYAAGSPFLFGWAKPVPINPHRLRFPRWDMVLVALAGPLSNVLLALASAAAMRWLAAPEDPLALLVRGDDAAWPMGFRVAFVSLLLNVGLAVFNMLPILPLDGGRVLRGFLPGSLGRAYAQTERFGLLAVVLLSSTEVLGTITGPLRRLLLGMLLSP